MAKLTSKQKEELKVAHAYQEIFSTPAGKIVLEDMAKASGFLADDMDPNPHVMAYNVGARQFFSRILVTIKEDLHETLKRYESADAVNEGEEDEE